MTTELFEDYLSRETDWFIQNASRSLMVADPRRTVSHLLAICEAKGLHFRNTVALASAWIDDNGRRAPRKKVALFYVRWFERQIAPPPEQFIAVAVVAPPSLTSWVKGLPGV